LGGAYFVIKTSNLDCNLFIGACLIKMPYGKNNPFASPTKKE
jgi:hypothetical protein